MMPKIQAGTNMPHVYAKDISKAKTRYDLCFTLESYHDIAEDAYNARPINTESFREFRVGLLRERKGEFAGEDWAKKYGAISMPKLMLMVSMVAHKYKVPWGLAFIRLKDAGYIFRSTNNSYNFIDKQKLQK